MAQDIYDQSEQERKAAVKQAIDDSFCGVLICHNSETDNWEIKGYSEVGCESGILEAMNVAVVRAKAAVDELLY